jgi:hypothetical protein
VNSGCRLSSCVIHLLELDLNRPEGPLLDALGSGNSAADLDEVAVVSAKS